MQGGEQVCCGRMEIFRYVVRGGGILGDDRNMEERGRFICVRLNMSNRKKNIQI
jgi:hypothetical protein